MSESGEPGPQAAPVGDAELIKAVASGDTAAYTKLCERHMAPAGNLAGNLVADPATAKAVLSETFVQVHSVLGRGEGPTQALRPFLLTALRRVAHERLEGSERADAATSQQPIPNLGEPLFTDPAVAELENDPLARAFRSLPERQQAVLWHTEIERGDPAEAAAILGCTADGLTELGEQARAAVSRTYLDLHASARAGLECEEAAAKLDLHLAGTTRGADEAMVQRHLRSCRDCRAAAIELTGLSRSLHRTVAPIFLGPAAGAYLAAAEVKPAQTGTALPDLAAATVAWLSHLPERIRNAPRQQRALAGGVVLLAAVMAAGLTLTLAASGSPQHTAQQPLAAAIAPPGAPAPSPSPSRSTALAPRESATRPARSAGQHSPAPANSPAPAPSTPGTKTSPPHATPSPTPSPAPSVPGFLTPPPHRKHRHQSPAG
jgi:DNA-directed RNA polymerase specialized sigma24 family protein